MVAIFAEDPYVAEDAADLIELDANQLPVISDADQDPGEFDEGLGSTALLTHTLGMFHPFGNQHI